MLAISNWSFCYFLWSIHRIKSQTIHGNWANMLQVVHKVKALFSSGHSCLRVPQTKGELASVRILGTADYSATQTLFQDLRGLGTYCSYWFIFTDLNGQRSSACVAPINLNYGTKSKFYHDIRVSLTPRQISMRGVSGSGLLSSTLIQNGQATSKWSNTLSSGCEESLIWNKDSFFHLVKYWKQTISSFCVRWSQGDNWLRTWKYLFNIAGDVTWGAGVTTRPCQHTGHTAKFIDLSEPLKEGVARKFSEMLL